MKDLSDINFIEIISSFDEKYRINKGNIIIEILEDNYVELTDLTIKNIITLKKLGFKISIDDLSLGENEQNMSCDILIKLFENGIIPNYVKIDGKFLQKIINNNISINDITKIKKIIIELKKLGIKIVGEWVQNKEQGEKTRDIGIDLFQGRYLKDDFEINKTQNNFDYQITTYSEKISKEIVNIILYFRENQELEINLKNLENSRFYFLIFINSNLLLSSIFL